MYNYEMVQTVGKDSISCSRLFRDYVIHHQMEGLRVSVIDKEGRVILDSYDTEVEALGNHLQRTEIQQALREGSGYDIKRMSQSTHETYFYSATRFFFRRSHPVAGHRALLYHSPYQPTHWLLT